VTKEEAVSLVDSLNKTDSPVVQLFSDLNYTIVMVNYTYNPPVVSVTTGGPTTADGSSNSQWNSGLTSSAPKADLNSIALPVGVVVPAVVILGAAGSFLFIKYRRNRRAAHRARHWDMHNMYSGISMVDYA
jgi:hypothetical protein